MSRYIDIDETVKTFEKLHGEESTLLNCYNADWIVSFLEAQPTADVQEVRHAKFEIVKNRKGVCNNCHRLDSIDKLAKYCRYCGARLLFIRRGVFGK